MKKREPGWTIDEILGVAAPAGRVNGDPLGDRPTAQVVTSDRLADLLGVTAVRVGQLAAEGTIPRLGRNRFDLRAAIRAYAADLRAKATGRATSDAGYVSAKVRAANAQAEKIETANAITRRDLLPADEVEREWTAVLRDVRARLMAVPSRVGSRVPTMTAHDVREVEREIRDALAELTHG